MRIETYEKISIFLSRSKGVHFPTYTTRTKEHSLYNPKSVSYLDIQSYGNLTLNF